MSAPGTLPGPALRRLRWLLAALFIAIAVPSALLVRTTWLQLRFEALHQARAQAQALGDDIDEALQRLVDVEERRTATDYGYTKIGGALDAASNLVERSPLARFPVQSDWPGLLGWFQVDAQGRFSTPFLPEDAAGGAPVPVEANQRDDRSALAAQLRAILEANRLLAEVSGGKRDKTEVQVAAKQVSQQAFDALASRQQLGNAVARIDELKLKQNVQNELAQRALPDAQSVAASPAPIAQSADRDALPEERLHAVDPDRAIAQQAGASRALRKEQSAELKDLVLAESTAHAPLARVEARALGFFETELEPFRFNLLGDGHALLYRTVWRDGQRSVQGVLLRQTPLLEHAIFHPQRVSALATNTDLLVAWNDDVVALDGTDGASVAQQRRQATQLRGEVLHSMRLRPPLDGLTLIWHLRRLPAAPGAGLLAWTAGVLALVLLGSFVLLYRLALKQLKLARQRQDFVAAVSHELNTPLTSIRMYAEMLKAGWADASKQQSYYDYILGESERLSRLIANVLQLSRMERRQHRLELLAQRLPLLLDLLRSRLGAQAERADFRLDWHLPPADALEHLSLMVDTDALLQVFINLVDNALKFAGHCAPRLIELALECEEKRIVFSVRDHGPGLEPAQQRRAFELFYRGGNAAPGTGIGLAVVRQLVRAHGGEVWIDNAHPGARVQVRLPVQVT